jgi:hypothetical protein
MVMGKSPFNRRCLRGGASSERILQGCYTVVTPAPPGLGRLGLDSGGCCPRKAAKGKPLTP